MKIKCYELFGEKQTKEEEETERKNAMDHAKTKDGEPL